MEDLESGWAAIQYAHLAGSYQFPHRIQFRTIQMSTVFTMLQESVLPDVSLHCLAIGKPIAFAVLLENSRWSRCVLKERSFVKYDNWIHFIRI